MCSIKLTFVNNSKIPAADEVYVGFFTTRTDTFDITNVKQGGPSITWIYKGDVPAGNWYTLDDLSEGVNIQSFVAGRVYVCYNKKGAGGWPLNPDNAQAEPAQTLTQGGKLNPSFYIRYDKFEITVTPDPNDVADLTSIDYWGIPMSLKALQQGGTPTGGGVYSAAAFKPGVTAQKIFDALNPLTTPPVSGLPTQRGQPYPALVPGQFNGNNPPDTYPAPTPLSFARIIGPSSYGTVNPAGFPITPYNLLTDYLTHLKTTFGPHTTVGAQVPTLGGGVIAQVSGHFAGTKTSPKGDYDLQARIDEDMNISITAGDDGTPKGTNIQLAYKDLVNPSGIYGANPPSTINGVPQSGLPNDINGWIIADLLGGLNIGAVGSTVEHGGTMVGTMKSQDWYALNPADMFAGLQPGTNYYNQYAATLQPLSQAYNFPFSDRLTYPGAKIQVSLDQTYVDELQVTLDDATVDMGG